MFTSSSHTSSFTNLRTLDLHLISLPEDVGHLGRVVRNLRLRNCSTTINRFVQFLKRFTNLEDLYLSDIRTPSISKLESLDRSELPHLKGALEIGMYYLRWKYFAGFVCQLAVLPSALHTIVLFGYEGVPTEVKSGQRTFAGRKQLVEFRDCEFLAPHPALARLIRLSD